MEIISYVGATASGRSSLAHRKVKFLIPENTRFRIPKISMPKVNFRFFNSAKNILRRIPFLFIAAVFGGTVFFTFLFGRIISYSENFTGPVELVSLTENEVEFLNTAMAKFAMERTENSFDENGNVLSDDGTVLTAEKLGLVNTVSYSSYKVQSGDTISSISIKFGLTNISTLISVNEIENVRTLRAGQKLRVPNQDGVVYYVAKGDSLSGISKKYGISIENILDANDLSSRNISAGQELFIPGARMDSSSLKKAMGELFISPIYASWRLTSKFGHRADPFTGVASNHTGIDMACPTGTPIVAAMSGKVVYVGWSNIFGIYAIINHGNGYQTLYGHMSKSLCRTNQVVSQGTKIGLVGSTGYSTGPHLHFTVYKNGKLVDPLSLFKK